MIVQIRTYYKKILVMVFFLSNLNVFSTTPVGTVTHYKQLCTYQTRGYFPSVFVLQGLANISTSLGGAVNTSQAKAACDLVAGFFNIAAGVTAYQQAEKIKKEDEKKAQELYEIAAKIAQEQEVLKKNNSIVSQETRSITTMGATKKTKQNMSRDQKKILGYALEKGMTRSFAALCDTTILSGLSNTCIDSCFIDTLCQKKSFLDMIKRFFPESTKGHIKQFVREKIIEILDFIKHMLEINGD